MVGVGLDFSHLVYESGQFVLLG